MVFSTKFPELSDKTLVNLADALKIDTYRIFLPLSATETDIENASLHDLAQDLQKIRKDFNTNFDNALKTRGIKK